MNLRDSSKDLELVKRSDRGYVVQLGRLSGPIDVDAIRDEAHD